MPVCVVTGVGPGNGAACARRFARAGWRVAMLARSADKLRALESAIPGAHGFPADVAEAASVQEAFGRVRQELGPVDALVHNAGNAAFGGFLEITAEALESAWRVNTLSLFLCGRQAASDMLSRGTGAIVVIGATASLRGGAGFAAFAPAKGAQRLLAQSMARSLGPRGVHVAYVVVDGVIDTPSTRGFFRDRPDDFFLKPDSIAESVFHVATQEPSAWTFELDLRPYAEKW
ncbi:MAG TPA: short-chain dehydrogenase [Deltaproteobacteria bacterium]|jgi:NAD(P)-dependent dehydrogenase (short-subunit alcohol dehydrogenase family)|nr:short-chain dehydrogenase [Deltaproteobacteria bacterium]